MKIILLLIAVFLMQSSMIFSQNRINSYPLKIGNVFVFTRTEVTNYPGWSFRDSVFIRSEINIDTVANNKRYFKFPKFPFYTNQRNWLGYDSATGRLLFYDPTNNCNNYNFESLVDSLWAGLRDTVKFCGVSPYRNICTDTSSYNIFTQLKAARYFSWGYSAGGHLSYEIMKFVDGFGLIKLESGGSGPISSGYVRYILVGCLINGVLYGDTTNYLIGINKISSELPQEFKLCQNYPNPFNPVTNINYQIVNNTFVNLKIYDILGRAIQDLVNVKLKPGTYIIDFNGNNLASGIYYYSLFIDGKLYDTKKMVLLK
jgi:type IX secretion system substrate protein